MDACANAAASDRNNYDITIRFPDPELTMPWKVVYEIGEMGSHARGYDMRENDKLVQEEILIREPQSDGTRDAALVETRETTYHRALDEDSGEWSAWEVTDDTFSTESAGSRGNTGRSVSDVPSFCGFPLDDDTVVEYLGRGSVNGVDAKKYSIYIKRGPPVAQPKGIDTNPDVRSPFDSYWVWWVTDSGRTLRHKWSAGPLDEGGMDGVLSGWGEVNIITAPIPAPAPVPTPTP